MIEEVGRIAINLDRSTGTQIRFLEPAAQESNCSDSHFAGRFRIVGSIADGNHILPVQIAELVER